jgi:hypothetical protein
MLPETVAKAVVLANMKEHLIFSSRKASRQFTLRSSVAQAKHDSKSLPSSTTEVWQTRQLKEYHRVNGICYRSGKKYALGHKCSHTAQAHPPTQVAAITTESGDGGGLLSNEMLNMLEGVESLTEEYRSYLSLHAMSGTQGTKAIHLRALIQNQVLSVLVDSGSSHTFFNVSMVSQLHLLPQAAKPLKVNVANGQLV